MENATKAIVLVGSLMLGLMVFWMYLSMIRTSSDAEYALNERVAQSKILEFNTHYTSYLDRNDITPLEVVTMYNFTEDWLADNPMETLEFIVDNKTNLGQTGSKDEIIAKFLQSSHIGEANEKKYTIKDVIYGEGTGRIIRVELKTNYI